MCKVPPNIGRKGEVKRSFIELGELKEVLQSATHSSSKYLDHMDLNRLLQDTNNSLRISRITCFLQSTKSASLEEKGR